MSSMARVPVIDLSHVEKMYRGRVHALRGVSMRVEAGEIFGLLGPNGAGKSTLVKILMTVIRASRCEGTVLGSPVGDRETLAKVGYLPEHHRFPDYLTARQVLHHYAALARVPRRDRKRRAAELLELVGLREWGRKRVKGFSKGMRQRLGVANALMNDPQLVVLDEPTDGVDPVGRKEIRDVLVRLRAEGRTIFLNSHLLSELEMVCDRVAIMVKGKVWAQGTIDELTHDSRRYEIEVAPGAGMGGIEDAGSGGVQFLPMALSKVARFGEPAKTAPSKTLPGGKPAAADAMVVRGAMLQGDIGIEARPINGAPGQGTGGGGVALVVSTPEAAAIQPLIDALRQSGCEIRSVRPVRESLEDLFMRSVKDPVTGATLSPGANTNGGAA